jgi:hypothetical protein
MVHNLIPTHTLPVASQRSRACREVMEERRDISFRLQHVWPGMLDHEPSPLAGEGPPLMRRPSADAVAGNGWDGPPHHRGRADWVPIPRGLIKLLRRRGERRWNEHLRLLAYRPLATLGRPGRQFHRLLTNALPRC